MSTPDEGWADFTHTPPSSNVSVHELFKRYREFQESIASLSRKDLVARRWLKTVDDDTPLATLFFNLPPEQQPILFRKSTKADEKLLAIWLARAKAEAEHFYCAEEVSPFRGLAKEDLRKIARLSVDPLIVKELPRSLAAVGVILVYVYSLPAMNADGALFSLSTGHPVIAMSLRFPRLDYFWFTLLHELAHLVLHPHKLETPTFFDVEAPENDATEKAANRLAKDSLVDRNTWRSCEPRYDTSELAVLTYAQQEGVHPAIVAGLLRKEANNYKRYNSLVSAHDVRKLIFSL